MPSPKEIASIIREAFANGQAAAVVSIVPIAEGNDNSNPRLMVAEDGRVLAGSLGRGGPIDAEAAVEAARLIGHEHLEIATVQTADVRLVVEIARPPLELVICGAGHVGQAVAAAGLLLGFQVTVIDDRAEFASRRYFPDSRIRLISNDFVESLRTMKLTPATHIVIVTRGHKHDEICLGEVINSHARYIGMIGSRRRTTTIRTHLRKAGVDAESLRRLCAPIGLDIGALTPEEIAVAILAEIIRIRRGGTGGSLSDFVRREGDGK